MFKVDLDKVPHHPVISEIVDVLCKKTQNTDRGFFQAEVAHYVTMMPSAMRVQVETLDRGKLPINMYTLALATSGFGKGHSIDILENMIMVKFRTRLMGSTFQEIAEQNYWDIARTRAIRSGNTEQEEFDKVETEANRAGPVPFIFDSATTPAVKQLRGKLLLTNIGSINLSVDEIGLNFTNSFEVLSTYLELYDKGRVKPKLTKNTNDNMRNEDAEGITPANMLLFGTPNKLLDNGTTEDQFYQMLETGYGWRLIFGYGQEAPPGEKLTAAEIYDRLSSTENDEVIQKWSQHFYELADPLLHGFIIQVPRSVGVLLMEYKLKCEADAYELPEHEDIQKSELKHRYFKALKLAGAFAFVDLTPEMTQEQLLSAIKLIEESGKAFQKILNRDKPYARLAKFIANAKAEVTHVDLMEKLPFYKQGQGARNEQMALAIAWGYPRHIVIKKRFQDGIEFYSGETLEETDLNSVKVSYSDHFAEDYGSEDVPFDQLHQLTQAPGGMNWCSHGFIGGHRHEDKVNPGFNLLVLDVDEGTPLEVAKELLKDYIYHIYTTKRHQTEGHGDRFRVVLPMNYTLKLDSEDYKTFMKAIRDWLPFSVDEQANQRARKWSSYSKGLQFTNMDGQLFDCLPFIPRTSRNDEFNNQNKVLGNYSNLERWFAQRMAEGNRNNNLIRFALTLVDSGWEYMDVKQAVLDFNSKLSNGLEEEEIHKTVLVTVASKYKLDRMSTHE